MFMQQASIPLSRNWVWTTARNILQSDLSENFTDLAIEIASASDGIVRRELQDSRERVVMDPTNLDSLGRGLYGSLKLTLRPRPLHSGRAFLSRR